MQGPPDTHRTCSLLPRPPAPTDHPPAEPGSQAENAHRDHHRTALAAHYRPHRERPSREATTQTTQPTPPNPETRPTHPHQRTAGLACEPQGQDSRSNTRRPGKHGQSALTRAAHTTAETHRTPRTPKPPQTARRTAPNPTPGSAQRNTHSRPQQGRCQSPPVAQPPDHAGATRSHTETHTRRPPRARHRAGSTPALAPFTEQNQTAATRPPGNPNTPRRTTLKPTNPAPGTPKLAPTMPPAASLRGSLRSPALSFGRPSAGW